MNYVDFSSDRVEVGSRIEGDFQLESLLTENETSKAIKNVSNTLLSVSKQPASLFILDAKIAGIYNSSSLHYSIDGSNKQRNLYNTNKLGNLGNLGNSGRSEDLDNLSNSSNFGGSNNLGNSDNLGNSNNLSNSIEPKNSSNSTSLSNPISFSNSANLDNSISFSNSANLDNSISLSNLTSLSNSTNLDNSTSLSNLTNLRNSSNGCILNLSWNSACSERSDSSIYSDDSNDASFLDLSGISSLTYQSSRPSQSSLPIHLRHSGESVHSGHSATSVKATDLLNAVSSAPPSRPVHNAIASSLARSQPDRRSLQIENTRIYLHFGERLVYSNGKPIPLSYCIFRMINLVIDAICHKKNDAHQEIYARLSAANCNFFATELSIDKSVQQKKVHDWITRNIFNISLPAFVVESFIKYGQMSADKKDMTVQDMKNIIDTTLRTAHSQLDEPLSRQALDYIYNKIIAPAIPIISYQAYNNSIDSIDLIAVGSLEWRYLNAALMFGKNQSACFDNINPCTLIEFGQFLEALSIQPEFLYAHAALFHFSLMIQELRPALGIHRAIAGALKPSDNLRYISNKNVAATWNRIVDKYYDKVINKFSDMVPLIKKIMPIHLPAKEMAAGQNRNYSDKHVKKRRYAQRRTGKADALRGMARQADVGPEHEISVYLLAETLRRMP